MFWIRHPQPLLSTRAVAMQVVTRKAQTLRDTQLIILEKTAPAPDDVEAVAAIPASTSPPGG